MKKICLGTLLLFLFSAVGFAQEHESIASVADHKVNTMSFSTLTHNPVQNHFVFRPEESGKLVVSNSEGTRVEEHYFSKDHVLELGGAWPKGHYHIKIIGKDRTDFTRVRKD